MTLESTPAAAANVTVAWKKSLQKRLLHWFASSARAMPWRGTRDPYQIWVSEIMLQQTQVATVARYYPRFMAAFPTVTDLAAASEEQVLRQWEGLGYYRRARQMHRAAQVIVAEHGGCFPADPAVVQKLPGIGRYTTGAILSIAHDARLPILEANTIRLYSRLLAYRGDPYGSAGQRPLWQAATDWLPKNGAGTFNQAMMELGSLVCTPRNPRCDQCPLLSLCPTAAQNAQDEIPRQKVKTRITPVREVAVAVSRRGRLLLVRYTSNERWAGLWDFVRFPLEEMPLARQTPAIREQLRQLAGVEIQEPLAPITRIKHGVTRYRITLDCFAAEFLQAVPQFVSNREMRWVRPKDLQEFPLSVTGRKLSILLD